jgi:phosphoglycerol transferase MdoB-like AlkP superfamily enzyme
MEKISSLNNIRNKMFANNFLVFFHLFMVWLMRKSSFIYFNVKNIRILQLYFGIFRFFSVNSKFA